MRVITLSLGSISDIPRLRQVGAAVCEGLGFGEFARTRIVTTLVEIGRNAIVHGRGGRMMLSLEADGARAVLTAQTVDRGPGIEAARSGPHRTNGLGLGLKGAERIADRFSVQSDANGTTITLGFAADHAAEAIPSLASALADRLAGLDRADPAAGLVQQNHELMQAREDRELLLTEMHHRTRNNLALISSLVRMSGRGARTDEARDLLADIERRIGAVIGVHGQLEREDEGDRLRLIPFLSGIAERTRAAFAAEGRRVEIAVQGDDLHGGPRMGWTWASCWASR